MGTENRALAPIGPGDGERQSTAPAFVRAALFSMTPLQSSIGMTSLQGTARRQPKAPRPLNPLKGQIIEEAAKEARRGGPFRRIAVLLKVSGGNRLGPDVRRGILGAGGGELRPARPAPPEGLPAPCGPAALDLRRLPAGGGAMSRTPRPRLRCPVCDGAPRLPRDLRQPVAGSGSGTLLRVALVPARNLTVTPDWDEAPADRPVAVTSPPTAPPRRQ